MDTVYPVVPIDPSKPGVPSILQDQVLDSPLYVEFLAMGGVVQESYERWGKTKNHVVFRIKFKTPMDPSPADKVFRKTEGVRVSMEVKGDMPYGNLSDIVSPVDGQMEVRILPFHNRSRKAIMHFSFPMAETKLKDFLEVATKRGLHKFKFNLYGGLYYMGCRDFLSQYFYWLKEDGIVERLESISTTKGPPSDSFYNLITQRYSYKRVDLCEIREGTFDAYVRVILPKNTRTAEEVQARASEYPALREPQPGDSDSDTSA